MGARAPARRDASKGVIERDVEASIPDMDADIVLYCGGGYRSALAADNLQRMGYRRVSEHADGGSARVDQAGLPVVRD